MIFQSQVLEYIKQLESSPLIESCEIILFRHQDNFHKKKEVEGKIRKYVSNYKSFATFSPPLLLGQLWIDAYRLKKYISSKYNKDEKIGVICRGDFATYIAAKSFEEYPNSRILYDNRGLPIEESLYSHPNGLLHRLNRIVKSKSINYSKFHCDMYNFVTNNMREYLLEKYNYRKNLPFTIIPTLYNPKKIEPLVLEHIKSREGYKDGDSIICYVGSGAAWQETDRLIKIISKIHEHNDLIRFFILTNAEISELDSIPKELHKRITVKQVQHNEMMYYLHLSNIGIVIRDDNIINQVAAPTKIAEYITSGLPILYSGKIGIIDDIKKNISDKQFVSLDSDSWLDSIDCLIKNKQGTNINYSIQKYFDMSVRQNETITVLESTFKRKKVR